MSEPADVLVLRKSVHRLPIENYYRTLQKRLPDLRIQLARTPREEREMLPGVPVVTGMEFRDELLDYADNINWFACTFAGTDHLPMDAFRDRGITVTNASGVHGPNIGEHAVGAMLIFSRRFHKGWRLNQHNSWRHYQGFELEDSTVTIVGMGAIGTAIAKRLDPFNVRRIGIRHSPHKSGPVEEVLGYDEDNIHDAFSRSDYVVLACPLTELTEHLINRDTLVTLQPHAVLVNVARGGVVHTDELVRALKKGELRGAALDVTDPEPLPDDHPLWNLQNVLITPHNAGNTPNYFDRMSDIIETNYDRYRDGSSQTLLNEVNL